MSDFIDMACLSFSSSTQPEHQQQKEQPGGNLGTLKAHRSQDMITDGMLYTEIELLKVKAPRSDMERFDVGIQELIRRVSLPVEADCVVPGEELLETQRRIQKARENQEEKSGDFLDKIFTDTIPFFHDLLVMGSPEVQFYMVKGTGESLDIFNVLCNRMCYNEGLDCKVELTDRRKIAKNNMKDKVLDTTTDVLENVFTDDLSKHSPMLHSLIVS